MTIWVEFYTTLIFWAFEMKIWYENLLLKEYHHYLVA